MNIITRQVTRPRVFRWQAVADDYRPGDPVGYGRTESAAIIDLQNLKRERAERYDEVRCLLRERRELN